MSDKIEMNTLAEMPSEYLASELPFSLLIEILRKQGFVIGLDSMEAMYFLLQKAIHAEQLHKLPFWLCPVVAQSAEQQAIFMELYKRTMLPVVDVKEEVKDKKERIENKQTETNTQISEPTIVQSKPEIKEQRKKIVASLKATGIACIRKPVGETSTETQVYPRNPA